MGDQDRRKHPMEPLAECLERNKRMESDYKQMFGILVEKIDGLTNRFDRINGRWEDHLTESMPYRSLVNEHEKKLTEQQVYRRQIISSMAGIIIAIILQVGGFVYLWGRMAEKVEDQDSDIKEIFRIQEVLHPRKINETNRGTVQ